MKPLMCATFASMFLVNASNAWLPAFLIRTHGLTTAQMGIYGAIAIGGGGVLGALSGLLCERVRSRVRNPESMILLATISCALPTMFVIVFSHSLGLAIGGMMIFVTLSYAWLAPTARMIQDAVEPDRRSTAVAMCSGFGMLLALGVGIPLIGWISDALAPRFGSLSLGLALCAMICVAGAIGLASHMVILRGLNGRPGEAAR
jgi:MFS family permease